MVGDIELGIDFWESAGKKVVEMKEKHDDFFKAVTERCDWITMEMLTTLESIGKKELHPRLLLAPKFTMSRFASLPYEDQKYAVENPIPLAVNGSHQVNRHIADMTPREVRQVVGPNGIRSVNEQREVLVKQETAAKMLGRFQLTLMNGRVFVKQTPCDAVWQKIEVDAGGNAWIEIVQKTS